ncbi:MAG: DHHA1 domain-containing protein [Hespellia sp.]|nr:DHHA1 domain-containing protein [Hespellia sp.]
MNTTVKLFDQDAYMTSASAKVLSCEEMKQDHETVYQAVLDQTIFFPEGGGQSPDRGTIDGIEVMDVQVKHDIITHTLKAPVPVGSEVTEEVEWNHRFSNMQQHSGEHIFSGLVHAKYGYNNVGFHLSDQIVTMDFSGPLTNDQITEIEWEVNQCIAKNLPVEVSYPATAELDTMDYRSKIEIDGQVRIITISGYDVCACCGTHVKATGEIGVFKVVNSQNYKGGVRISMLCGFRALADYRQKQDNVVKISNTLSVKQEEAAIAVEKIKNELTVIRQQLNSAKEELMIQKVSQIDAGEKHVCLFENAAEADAMRAAVNTLTDQHDGYCAIFVGNDESGYRYIVGVRDGDAREMGNLLKEKFQAKGGGKPAMVQGSLKGNQMEIEALFREMR